MFSLPVHSSSSYLLARGDCKWHVNIARFLRKKLRRKTARMQRANDVNGLDAEDTFWGRKIRSSRHICVSKSLCVAPPQTPDADAGRNAAHFSTECFRLQAKKRIK